MICLNVQFQPSRRSCDAGVHADDGTAHLDTIIAIATEQVPDAAFDVQRGEDDGLYININFDTNDIVSLWDAISELVTSDPLWESATIACCEGDNGWDDYLLLYHFDETEQLDTLTLRIASCGSNIPTAMPNSSRGETQDNKMMHAKPDLRVLFNV